MRFGLFFIAASPRGQHQREFEEILEQCQYAEELGYDSVWFAEHHSAYGIIGNPAVLMAAVAQRTRRIRLGTAVAILNFQNPIRLAEDYALVDVLSHGRLDFGMGRANQDLEYRMMRADKSESKAAFWEAFDIIRGLWAGGKVTFHGKHFQFDNVETFPKPVQKPIPMYVAAVSAETYAQAVERGIQVMTAGGVSGKSEDVRQRLLQTARGLIAAGWDPGHINFPLAQDAYFAATVEQAKQEYEGPYWAMHLLAPHNPLAGVQGQVDASEKLFVGEPKRPVTDSKVFLEDAVQRGAILVTDPSGARAAIGRMRDEFGLTEYIAVTNKGGNPHKQVLSSMKLFAEEVMPAFKADDLPPIGVLANQERDQVRT